MYWRRVQIASTTDIQRKTIIDDLAEVADGSDSDDRSGTGTESPSFSHPDFFTENSVKYRSARGPEPCTESELNYPVSAPLYVVVLAEVRKRPKISATMNDSLKVDVSAGSDRGVSTSNSIKGDVSAGKESVKGPSAKKGGTSAD